MWIIIRNVGVWNDLARRIATLGLYSAVLTAVLVYYYFLPCILLSALIFARNSLFVCLTRTAGVMQYAARAVVCWKTCRWWCCCGACVRCRCHGDGVHCPYLAVAVVTGIVWHSAKSSCWLCVMLVIAAALTVIQNSKVGSKHEIYIFNRYRRPNLLCRGELNFYMVIAPKGAVLTSVLCTSGHSGSYTSLFGFNPSRLRMPGDELPYNRPSLADYTKFCYMHT